MITSISASAVREYFRIALISSAIIIGILVILGFPVVSSFLAILLLAICFFPTYDYLKRGGTGIPAMPVLFGAYGLQFALPTFIGDRVLVLAFSSIEIPESLLISALLIAILGASTLLLVCSSSIVLGAVDKLPRLSLQLDPFKAMVFCIAFGAIALAISPFTQQLSEATQSQYSALFRVLHNQLFVVIAILGWLVAFTRKVGVKLVWYGVIAIAVIDGASSSFLEATFAPIGIMFLCNWIYFQKVNRLLLVALVLAFLFLNPVKGQVRERLWSSGEGDSLSKVQKAQVWVEEATDFWADVIQKPSERGEALAELIKRTNLIDLLAHVYEQTPDYTPYLYGESYSFFVYSMIPRVIWPEKPEASANRLLAVKYGLTTSEGAEISTFGISLVGEGYANFGLFGVVLIMAVLGLTLLAMMRLLGSSASGPGGIAIFLSFFIYFLNGLGTSAEILFGNVFQSMIASYILLYWAKAAERTTR